MSYRIINGQVYSIGNIGESSSKVNLQKNKTPIKEGYTFKDFLDKEIESKKEYKLSKHAVERLSSINFKQEDFNNLRDGIRRAREKGSKNTVMVYKEMAILASVENNTIITVVEKERVKENVFTNIDSVVII
ncbi:TIGR02530 family flagellar biosynthesis protein [Clostridium mediterraneense]|uniref:TIGR02530 family flagellar biosynthesis protein n=1 Tax=Clostridium mediterraneense TaxID=1805472 RepID=UPI00082CBCF7|nr:TIGR02530 family flagellar biosynthesis protein [Clostridium mediterraneense]